MKHLFVYRVRDLWFGRSTESKPARDGGVKKVTNIAVPQSIAEIEAFAVANGYTVEWGSPTSTVDSSGVALPGAAEGANQRKRSGG